MWKPSQSGAVGFSSIPEPFRPVPPTPVPEVPRPAPTTTSGESTIGKDLLIKGEITGSESVFIDGKVEGGINLPGNRVTVGGNGRVTANVNVDEIVILGRVEGNVSASDRVDIRAEGSLCGDVCAARIHIEDGAYFKGSIDIRKPEATPPRPGATATTMPEPPKSDQA